MNSSASIVVGRVVTWLGVAGTIVATSAVAQPVSDAPVAPPIQPDQSLITAQVLHPIFNGTNLNGWVARGGKASYAIEDGVIVGTCAVKGGGNTFLCTEKQYGDFVLELEIKADAGLNSGVQVRSQCFDAPTTYDFGNREIKIPAGRVHGYQIEVDHRPERRWSGGVYDEARRDWLNPLPAGSAAGQAFKFGEWNHYRIQCLGPSIKTWVNGVPAADLLDAETLRGLIGLQVHASEKVGAQIRFRNVRLRDLGSARWQTAWDVTSLEGMEQRGPGEWNARDGILSGVYPATESKPATLTSPAVLTDFSARYQYKIQQGGFAQILTETDSGKVAFEFPVAATVGATNVAHSEDWNTLVLMVQGPRLVININGHKVADTNSAAFAHGVNPGFRLAGGAAAAVDWKDFEILTPGN